MDDKKKEEELAAKIKADAEVKAKAEADAKEKAEFEATESVRLLAEKDEKLAKLTEERDNYKKVALKRLGKLPGDEGFMENADKDTGLTVEEQVKKALLDNEVSKANADRETLVKNQAKQISELTLALKNRPNVSIGGSGSGEPIEVKDNVLSEQQIATIKTTAVRLKVKDVDAYVEKAKQNILKNNR